ncbi:hypothetical protein V5799_007208 [Amblyomma americanum]|uniref:Uncharacterized protein n=1 Tax=Amblyomma americanum TaxID=6943 RepID=A0AAQ4DU66_AMBAM
MTSWSPLLTAALVKLNRGRVLVREENLRRASYTVCDRPQLRYACSTPGFYFLGINHVQLNVVRTTRALWCTPCTQEENG